MGIWPRPTSRGAWLSRSLTASWRPIRPDGFLYAAQNGGVVGDWRADRPAVPSIEQISLEGEIVTLTTEIGGVPLKAPNDLVFGPDRRLYLTDPSEPYDPDTRRAINRLFAVGDNGGEVVLIELHPSYVNGLAFTPDDRLVWVESYSRDVCLLEEGIRVRLCTLPDDHVPDGLDIAADGRLHHHLLVARDHRRRSHGGVCRVAENLRKAYFLFVPCP
jgi:gluconolactonase